LEMNKVIRTREERPDRTPVNPYNCEYRPNSGRYGRVM